MDPAAAWAAKVIVAWLREEEPSEPDALYANDRVRIIRLAHVVLVHDCLKDERTGNAYVDEDAAVQRFTQAILRFTYPDP